MSNSLATKGLLGDAIALATQGVLSASTPDTAPVFICLHGELVRVLTLGGSLTLAPTISGGLTKC